jgi:hypothetical protein
MTKVSITASVSVETAATATTVPVVAAVAE